MVYVRYLPTINFIFMGSLVTWKIYFQNSVAPSGYLTSPPIGCLSQIFFHSIIRVPFKSSQYFRTFNPPSFRSIWIFLLGFQTVTFLTQRSDSLLRSTRDYLSLKQLCLLFPNPVTRPRALHYRCSPIVEPICQQPGYVHDIGGRQDPKLLAQSIRANSSCG